MGDRLLKESDVLRLMVRYPIQNSMFYKDVKMLPSADIPKGKWSNIDNYYGTAICTNCKKVTMFEKWGSKPIKQYDFCPNCGARMVKDE